MDIGFVKNGVATTPAYVINAKAIFQMLENISTLREACGVKVLYSIKALPLVDVLKLAQSYVDGFSVSSLFEARLAHEVSLASGSIHLTTPGIRPHEVNELTQVCSHVSVNSLHQHQLFAGLTELSVSLGLRVNPELSFTKDARFDPCRTFSKLGITLDVLSASEISRKISGLHFHTVFGESNFSTLLSTIAKLRPLLDKNLANLKWLNLGGGYLYGQMPDYQPFIKLVNELKHNYGLEIFIEPGNAMVNHAGYLISTVIDRFTSGGKVIAVLDTSINHHPEVFEYQRTPSLVEHDEHGENLVLLAGSTCLAGDLFGEYRLKTPLQIGDRVVFNNVGAYSLVKANRFNGYNLPDIYWHQDGQVRCIKQHSYASYRDLWC